MQALRTSIKFYDKAAANAQIEDYVPVTDNEIMAYKNAPAIVYNPAKALEQIAIQEYINFYKQPNEAWALYKRTGMPNSSTALMNEDIMIDGSLYHIPRRAALAAPSSSDLNATNKEAALTEMMKDPNFGSAIDDVYGRVWWDVP